MRLLMSFFVLSFLGLAGCTKSSICDTGKVAGNMLSAQIATQFDCKDLDAVRADIEKQLVQVKICDVQKPAAGLVASSAIGSAICKPVIDAIAGGLLTQIPTSWKCSGGALSDDVKAKLLAACAKAL